MAVQYNKNSINVSISNKDNKDLLIYAHPGDKINFDFDISALDKEVLNGDLVIRLLNGRTVTVVNFGLMALDNKVPTIDDSAKSYSPLSLFGGTGYYEDSGVGSYVISRQVSSPDDPNLPSGKDLPTAKGIADGQSAESKQVGNFFTPEQNVVPEFGPLFREFVTKTLQHANIKTYEVPVVYSAKNYFNYTDPDNDIFPVKLLLINPKVIPEYGTNYTTQDSEHHRGYYDLFIDLGGAQLKGNDYATFMTRDNPQTIDLSQNANPLYFDGPNQTNMITRYFSLEIDNKTVAFNTIVISGLPAGVIVPKGLNPNLEIKPLGAGSYQITVKGSAMGGVEIPIQYAVGMGGNSGVFSTINVSYEGVQSKTGNLVKGGNTVYFEFKPVHTAGDISNFSKFNTYTFSNLMDPLIVRFSNNSDVIKGGKGDYTYYGNAGNDKAYGGEATEVFHLGVGNNEFYAGTGNDTVDTDLSNADNKLYLSDAIDKADSNSTAVTIDQGKVIFTGKKDGTQFNSTMQGFKTVYFDKGDSGEVTRDDTLYINSTRNLPVSTIVDMGKGNNIVRAGSSAITVDFMVPTGGTDKVTFITTDGTVNGVFVEWEGTNKIIGSKANDTLRAYNDSPSVNFDGAGNQGGGGNIADYSAVSTDITFDAANATVARQGFADTVVNIQTFNGASAPGVTNTFYGGLSAKDFSGRTVQTDIKYIGNGNGSTLSYEKLAVKTNNGVIIDFSTNTVTKNGSGGKDFFSNINNVTASNNDDTIIVSPVGVNSNVLDGLDGFNTIDYSKLSVTIAFSFNSGGGSSGSVAQGGGAQGVDTISNFRYLKGSSAGSVFNLNDFDASSDTAHKYRYVVDAGRSNPNANTVSYKDGGLDKNAVVLDMQLGSGGFFATVYKGSTATGGILGIDNIKGVANFTLSSNASNQIFMYSKDQLAYNIGGNPTNNTNFISFERSKGAVNLDFKANNYNNIVGVDTLKLSNQNDSVIMGTGFFGKTIDGLDGVNSIDFSSLTAGINASIDLENIKLEDINIGTKTIDALNFQQIKATASDDTFKINFDLKNIDDIKNKQISLDGEQGINTIDFTGVTDSQTATNGLFIDLSNGVGATVKKVSASGGNVLTFNNFTNITGSAGDDTFVLPSTGFNFNIDGGGGTNNAVSYQQYAGGIKITPETLSKFNNIQKIIGSQGDDVVTLGEDTGKLKNIDGFEGFDTVNYTGVFAAATTVDITKDQITVTKGSGVTNILQHIQSISFFQTTGSRKVTYNVNTDDNSVLDSKDKTLFLVGGSDYTQHLYTVDYGQLNTGVTLNLALQSNLAAQGYWISVNKGTNNSIDYLQNIDSIKLSAGDDKVMVENTIGSLPNITELTIDGGAGNNALSYQNYIGDIVVDVDQTTQKILNVNLVFTGFNNFVGVNINSNSSTFKSNDGKDYTFDGLSSNSTLDYSKITSGNIAVTIDKGASGNYDKLTITKPNGKDTALNIANYLGSGGNDTITINAELDQNMSFNGGGGTNSISYGGFSNPGIMTFVISQNGISVNKSSGLYTDTIEKFTNVTGSQGNNRFTVGNSFVSGSTDKYVLDGNGGVNTIGFTDVNSDLNFELGGSGATKISVTASGGRNFVDFANMAIVYGSNTNANTFKVGNFFNKDYMASGTLTIFGNTRVQTNTLDLTDFNSSLSLDPLNGRIQLASSGANDPEIVTPNGIQIIKLGNGDDSVFVTSGGAAGWQEIDGGGGQNTIDFSKSFSALNYDLGTSGGIAGLTITNFTGVVGTAANDIFSLKNTDAAKAGMRIDGGGGTLDTLDYSDLLVAVTVDVANNKVTRGTIDDQVSNMQVFKTGSGGGEFLSARDGSYQFMGFATAVDNNTLSYAGVDVNLTFNFNGNIVSKGGGGGDTFANISKFTGGSKTNTFLFSTANIAPSVTNITLDGGTGAGATSIVNLMYLTTGVTYDIARGSFTTPLGSGNLTVNLTNIAQFVGTSQADTFIFSDNVDKFFANGGDNAAGIHDTIDLNGVTTGVTVDFANKSINFNGKVNQFLNVDTFIGSSAGGNIFKGLDNNSSYIIDGGSASNNTISYDAASASLALSVNGSNIIINKGGSFKDSFTNIQELTLSNLDDKLTIDKATDLAVYGAFSSINGGSGSNAVEFTNAAMGNTITVDLDAANITVGSTTQSIKLTNFNSFLFSGDGSQTYTIKAKADNFTLQNVVFGTQSTTKGNIDLSLVTEGLTILLDDAATTRIMGATSGNVGSIVNLGTLTLGNQVYNISYATFDPNSPSTVRVNTGATATTNISIGTYSGASSTIGVAGNALTLDGGVNFANATSLSVAAATKDVNINLTALAATNFNLRLDNFSTASSTVTLTVGTGTSDPTANFITLGEQGALTVSDTAAGDKFTSSIFTNSGILNISKASTIVLAGFNNNFKTAHATALTTAGDLVLDLSELPATSGMTINIGKANNTYEVVQGTGGASSTIFTVDVGALNKNIVGSSSNDTFVVVASNASGKVDGGKGVNTVNLNPSSFSGTTATITATNITLTGGGANVNLTTSSINIINLVGGNGVVDADRISVQPYKGLTNVNFGTTGNDGRKIAVDYRTSNINNINSTITLHDSKYGDGSFFYSGGSFAFTNLNGSKGASSPVAAEANFWLADNSTRDQIAFTTQTPGQDITDAFNFDYIFKVGYNSSTARNSLIDFSGASIGKQVMGIRLMVDTTVNNGATLFQQTGKAGGFYLFGIANVNFNLTDASDNSKKLQINIDNDFYMTNGSYKLTLGDMNTMTLPSSYAKTGSWGDDPSKYDTYNNQIIFSGNAGGDLSGNLLLNSNNQSIFSKKGSTDTSIDISGANMFWGPDDTVKTNFSVYQIADAHPFAIMLSKNTGNVLDFSNVKDGNAYLWEGQYAESARGGLLPIVITDEGAASGDVGNTFYGVIGSVAHLILSGSNDIFSPTISLQNRGITDIDGAGGYNTFTLGTAGYGTRILDFTKYNDGFEYSEGSAFNIDFKNFNIIEGYRQNSGTAIIKADINGTRDTSTVHNFTVQRGHNADGSLSMNKMQFQDTSYSGSWNVNAYVSRNATLLSSDIPAGNTTFLGKDFAFTDIITKNISVVFGTSLDFSNLPSGNKDVTVNVTGLSGSVRVTYAGDQTGLSYHITGGTMGAAYITATDNNSGGSITFNFSKGITVVNSLTTYYYSYLAAHQNVYGLVDNNNTNTNPNYYNANPADHIQGANNWDSQQQYLDALNKTAASSDYWKQLDGRINDALNGNNDNSRNKRSADNDSSNKDTNANNANQQSDHNNKDSGSHNNAGSQNVAEAATDNSNSNHSSHTAKEANASNGDALHAAKAKVANADLTLSHKGDINLLDKFNNSNDQKDLANNNKEHNNSKQDDSSNSKPDDSSTGNHSGNKDKATDSVDGNNGHQTKLDGNDSNAKESNSTTNGEHQEGNYSSNGENHSGVYANDNGGGYSHTMANTAGEFNLNAVLEAAKSSGNGVNHSSSTLADDFGLGNISAEVLEGTYKQDEANSMAYTIDASHSYGDSYHSTDHNSASSVEQQQKSKVTH